MYFDADKNDHGLPYNPIKALTVPRPIGWISTISKNGVGNLAPYSYFNGLSYTPPFVMFSGGSREDGSKKDSVLNAEETGEFVFNIATWDNKDKMNDTSWIDDPDIDELRLAPAYGRHLAVLKNAQQLRLQVERHVAVVRHLHLDAQRQSVVVARRHAAAHQLARVRRRRRRGAR